MDGIALNVVRDLSGLVTRSTGLDGKVVLEALTDAKNAARQLAAAAVVGASDAVRELTPKVSNLAAALQIRLFGKTPMHSILANGDFDLAMELMAKGASLNGLDEHGRNPVEAYVYKGLPFFRGDDPIAEKFIQLRKPKDVLTSLNYDFTKSNAKGQNLLDIAIEHPDPARVNFDNIRDLCRLGVSRAASIKTIQDRIKTIIEARAAHPDNGVPYNETISQWQKVLRMLGVETSPT